MSKIHSHGQGSNQQPPFTSTSTLPQTQKRPSSAPTSPTSSTVAPPLKAREAWAETYNDIDRHVNTSKTPEKSPQPGAPHKKRQKSVEASTTTRNNVAKPLELDAGFKVVYPNRHKKRQQEFVRPQQHEQQILNSSEITQPKLSKKQLKHLDDISRTYQEHQEYIKENKPSDKSPYEYKFGKLTTEESKYLALVNSDTEGPRGTSLKQANNFHFFMQKLSELTNLEDTQHILLNSRLDIEFLKTMRNTLGAFLSYEAHKFTSVDELLQNQNVKTFLQKLLTQKQAVANLQKTYEENPHLQEIGQVINNLIGIVITPPIYPKNKISNLGQETSSLKKLENSLVSLHEQQISKIQDLYELPLPKELLEKLPLIELENSLGTSLFSLPPLTDKKLNNNETQKLLDKYEQELETKLECLENSNEIWINEYMPLGIHEQFSQLYQDLKKLVENEKNLLAELKSHIPKDPDVRINIETKEPKSTKTSLLETIKKHPWKSLALLTTSVLGTTAAIAKAFGKDSSTDLAPEQSAALIPNHQALDNLPAYPPLYNSKMNNLTENAHSLTSTSTPTPSGPLNPDLIPYCDALKFPLKDGDICQTFISTSALTITRGLCDPGSLGGINPQIAITAFTQIRRAHTGNGIPEGSIEEHIQQKLAPVLYTEFFRPLGQYIKDHGCDLSNTEQFSYANNQIITVSINDGDCVSMFSFRPENLIPIGFLEQFNNRNVTIGTKQCLFTITPSRTLTKTPSRSSTNPITSTGLVTSSESRTPSGSKLETPSTIPTDTASNTDTNTKPDTSTRSPSSSTTHPKSPTGPVTTTADITTTPSGSAPTAPALSPKTLEKTRKKKTLSATKVTKTTTTSASMEPQQLTTPHKEPITLVAPTPLRTTNSRPTTAPGSLPTTSTNPNPDRRSLLPPTSIPKQPIIPTSPNPSESPTNPMTTTASMTNMPTPFPTSIASTNPPRPQTTTPRASAISIASSTNTGTGRPLTPAKSAGAPTTPITTIPSMTNMPTPFPASIASTNPPRPQTTTPLVSTISTTSSTNTGTGSPLAPAKSAGAPTTPITTIPGMTDIPTPFPASIASTNPPRPQTTTPRASIISTDSVTNTGSGSPLSPAKTAGSPTTPITTIPGMMNMPTPFPASIASTNPSRPQTTTPLVSTISTDSVTNTGTGRPLAPSNSAGSPTTPVNTIPGMTNIPTPFPTSVESTNPPRPQTTTPLASIISTASSTNTGSGSPLSPAKTAGSPTTPVNTIPGMTNIPTPFPASIASTNPPRPQTTTPLVSTISTGSSTDTGTGSPLAPATPTQPLQKTMSADLPPPTGIKPTEKSPSTPSTKLRPITFTVTDSTTGTTSEVESFTQTSRRIETINGSKYITTRGVFSRPNSSPTDTQVTWSHDQDIPTDQPFTVKVSLTPSRSQTASRTLKPGKLSSTTTNHPSITKTITLSPLKSNDTYKTCTLTIDDQEKYNVIVNKNGSVSITDKNNCTKTIQANEYPNFNTTNSNTPWKEIAIGSLITNGIFLAILTFIKDRYNRQLRYLEGVIANLLRAQAQAQTQTETETPSKKQPELPPEAPPPSPVQFPSPTKSPSRIKFGDFELVRKSPAHNRPDDERKLPSFDTSATRHHEQRQSQLILEDETDNNGINTATTEVFGFQETLRRPPNIVTASDTSETPRSEVVDSDSHNSSPSTPASSKEKTSTTPPQMAHFNFTDFKTVGSRAETVNHDSHPASTKETTPPVEVLNFNPPLSLPSTTSSSRSETPNVRPEPDLIIQKLDNDIDRSLVLIVLASITLTEENDTVTQELNEFANKICNERDKTHILPTILKQYCASLPTFIDPFYGPVNREELYKQARNHIPNLDNISTIEDMKLALAKLTDVDVYKSIINPIKEAYSNSQRTHKINERIYERKEIAPTPQRTPEDTQTTRRNK